MENEPRYAADYRPEAVALIRATCLYLATKLGDFRDELVVVGGPAKVTGRCSDGDLLLTERLWWTSSFRPLLLLTKRGSYGTWKGTSPR